MIKLALIKQVNNVKFTQELVVKAETRIEVELFYFFNLSTR